MRHGRGHANARHRATPVFSPSHVETATRANRPAWPAQGERLDRHRLEAWPDDGTSDPARFPGRYIGNSHGLGRAGDVPSDYPIRRSEEHTSELQSLRHL